MAQRTLTQDEIYELRSKYPARGGEGWGVIGSGICAHATQEYSRQREEYDAARETAFRLHPELVFWFAIRGMTWPSHQP